MNISLFLRRRILWLNLPSTILIALLQRTPVARLMPVAGEMVISSPLGTVLKSALASVASLGAMHTLAGATELVTSQPSPASATVGTPITIAFSIAGTTSGADSWDTSGSVPGLSFGGTSSDTLTLSGTPTTVGSYTVSVQASDPVGGSTPTYSYTVNVTAGGGGGGNVAPSISTHPNSQTVTAGSSVTFTAAASGTPAPTYQWRKDGNPIGGATNASLTLNNVQAGDAGTYTMVATNAAGSATSNGAVLTVSAATSAPSFTTHPNSQTVSPGGSVTFTAAANGNPAPTYQWRKDGNPIGGATNASLTLSNAQAGDAGTYTVIATNSAGSATSNGAVLTVSAATSAPSFTTHPSSQTVTPGSSVTFTAAASGNPSPTYQWRKDGNPIGGATNATLTLPSAQAGDAGTYTAVATNSVGSATSNGAVLTVSAANVAPTITTQPQGQSATTGANVTFTVAASGNPTPTYQWYFGGSPIGGATSATLTLTSVQLSAAGGYYATATNSQGTATSNTATLTVTGAITVGSTRSQIATTGKNAAIAAAAGASNNLQWQVSANGGTTWSNLAEGGSYRGVNSRTLEIIGVTSQMNGYQYRYINADNTATTTEVTTLTVAAAFFPMPVSLAVDGSGNLYVGDASANTVQKVTSAGQVATLAGGSGQAGTTDGTGTAARFNQPAGIVIAGDGTLTVADTANATIRRITAAGVVTTLAGSASTRGNADGTGTAATFSNPVGVALDSAGNVYVADSMNHTIRKIAAGGVVTTFAGTAGASGSADGTGAAARFNLPTGVAVDGTGNVYVADSTNNLIRKISPAGVVTTLAGLAGVSGSADGAGMDALFNNPGGIVVDGSGNVYVADTGNSVIRKITPAGSVSTLAGLAGIAGLMDGTGINAWLNQPKALAIDAGGNLYVADTGNAAIRKITSAGVVTTQAFTAAPPPPTGGGGGSGGGGSGGGSGGVRQGGAGSTSAWLTSAIALLVTARWACQRRRMARH